DEDPEEDQVEGVSRLEGGLDAVVPEDRVRVEGVPRAEDTGRPGLVQRVDRVGEPAAPDLALRDREVERVVQALGQVEHVRDEAAEASRDAERSFPDPRPALEDELVEE